MEQLKQDMQAGIVALMEAVKNDYLIFRCYISTGYKFLQILTEQHKYRQKK